MLERQLERFRSGAARWKAILSVYAMVTAAALGVALLCGQRGSESPTEQELATIIRRFEELRQARATRSQVVEALGEPSAVTPYDGGETLVFRFGDSYSASFDYRSGTEALVGASHGFVAAPPSTR